MTLVVDLGVLALGAYLGIRGIAACYRVRDLWYTIGTAYPTVIRGLVGWGGIIFAAVLLLGDHQRRMLLSGLLAFLLFYLSLFPLRHLLLRRRRL